MSDIVDNTRYGIAFDKDFETVLLEAELNGTGILDYENDVMGLELLNYYLRKTEKRELMSCHRSICCSCVGGVV